MFSRSSDINSTDCSGRSGHYSSAYCYYTPHDYCSGNYVNCRCYIYSSSNFTSATCSNIGGYYDNSYCYYNSSTCPYNYYAGQCYRYSSYSYSYYNCPGVYISYYGVCYYN